MRDYIIIVSSLGGIFIEEENGTSRIWGSKRWYVTALTEDHVMRTPEYLEAIEYSEEVMPH